jgi:hypothetical protein
MATGLRRPSIFLCVLFLSAALFVPRAAMTQQVIDSYVAVIGQQDRTNSSGTALTQPAQILAQDRANFHRFGIRQAGDTADRTFLTAEGRAQMAGLLGNGFVEPAAAQAILGGQNAPVLVEVLGSGGRATALRVTLATGQQTGQQAGQQPGLPGLPGLGAQQPSDLAWNFGKYPAGAVSVVSADLYRGSDLLVSLRCLEANGAVPVAVAGIDPTPGMVTLHLAPQVAGSGVAGQMINAELALGPADRIGLPFDWRAPPGAFSANLLLVPGFAARLAEGGVAINAGGQVFDFAGSAGLNTVMPQLALACMSQTAIAAAGCAGSAAGMSLTQCIVPGRSAPMGQVAGLGLPQTGGQPQAVAGPVPAATDGNDAVQAAIFGWALSQHPEAATVSQYQNFIPRMALPPDAPPPPQGGISGPEFEAYLRMLAAYYANKPVPSRIRIEFPASLYPNAMNDGLRLSSAGRDIEGVHALTDLSLNWQQLHSTFRWVSQKPFYLPLPETLTMPARETGRDYKDRLMLSVVLTMSNPVIEQRGGLFRNITSDAEIEHVSLIRRTERRVQGKYLPEPDRLVTSWSAATNAGMAAPVPRPTDPAGMVAVFGGAVSAGRYVPEWDLNSVKGRALGVSNGIINKGQQTRSIETALGLGALLAAGPDRDISPEAAQEAIRHMLTEREGFDLFPVAYLSNPGSMNEIERRAALAAAQPGLRDIVTSRMPQLPLPVRDVGFATVQDYDFTLNGFPLNGQAGRWSPKDPLTGQVIKDLVPSFLPMPEAEAAALLRLMEQQGQMKRTLFVAVDYTLTDATVRAAASGPINPAEIGVVRLGSRIDGVTIFADPALTIPVAQPVTAAAQDDTGPNLLPDALFASTGKSLLGAMGRFAGGEAAISAEVSGLRDVARAPADQRPRLVASITQDIMATAQDEYWIGAHWRLHPYDADAGGYPVRSVGFRGVPHRDDVSGFAPPPLVGDASHAFEVLRIDPERRAEFEAYLDLDRAAHLDGMALTSNIRVRPIGVQEDRSGARLVVSAPLEIMLGQSQGNGSLLTDDHRFVIAAPPQLGPSEAGAPPITPPDVLMLDHEGIDLLTVSIAPEVLDDTAYERMLVERLLKERALAGAAGNAVVPAAVAWGRFFENPTQRLTAPEIARLVPIFRDWTQARAAQLPPRVAIPLGFNTQQQHTETGCNGLTEVIANAVGRRNTAAFDDYASHMPEAILPESGMRFGGNWPPRAGPDRLWVSEGRAVTNGTRAACHYVQRQSGRDSDMPNLDQARYADALVRIKAQPSLQASIVFSGATYIADLDEVTFARTTPARMDAPGLVGVLALRVTPVSVTGHHRNSVGEVEFAPTLGPDDWKVPVAVPPQAQDVVGLTLGMPLEAFLDAVREKLTDPVLFTPEKPVEGMFGTAIGLMDPDSQEAFVALYVDGLPDQPVIGIMRRIELSAERASPAALRNSLEAKYGPPTLEQAERYLLWGVLPESEDQAGFCGGMKTVSSSMGSNLPRMQTNAPERFGGDLAVPQSDFWYGAGWPRDESGGPSHAMKDPDRCGPVVTATLSERRQGTMLGVWLFDRKLAEMARAAPPPEVGKADIDL